MNNGYGYECQVFIAENFYLHISDVLLPKTLCYTLIIDIHSLVMFQITPEVNFIKFSESHVIDNVRFIIYL